VLSGAETSRRWRGPAPIGEVVRAAVAEVKEVGRVGLAAIEDIAVLAHAATDVMHLLAELIENAVTFSAPETRVTIAGQVLPGGYLIEVEDEGLGMSDEQLVDVNERLVNPPMDLANSRMLGFFVAGQLIQRHGIKVQLRHSWYGGVAALVLLPNDLLRRPASPQGLGGVPQSGAVPAGAAGQDGHHEASADLGLDLDWSGIRTSRVHMPLRRHPSLTRPSGNSTITQDRPAES